MRSPGGVSRDPRAPRKPPARREDEGFPQAGATGIHAETDPTLKANVMAVCESGRPGPGRSWKEDRDLMAFAKTMRGWSGAASSRRFPGA